MTRYPFKDVLHEKGTDPHHIRLISEGGSSLAQSPGPVCIDPIQVTHNCTSESQNTDSRSSPGACTLFASPVTSLFSVPLELALELDQGGLPKILRTRFQQQGIPLSDAARVEVQQIQRIWVITDLDRRYSIRKLTANLTIYRDAKRPA